MKFDNIDKKEMIYFGDVFYCIYRRWSLILIFVGVFFVSAVLYLAMATPKYEASLVICKQVTPGSDNTSLSSLNLPFSLGVSAGGVPDQYAKFLQIITSNEVAAAIDKKGDWRRKLFKSRWDHAQNTWEYAPGIISALRRQVARFFGYPVRKEPTSADLASLLASVVRIESIGDGRFHKVYIRLTSPELALDLLKAVVKQGDNLIRDREIADVDARLDFLRKELAGETVSTIRDSMSKQLSSDLYKRSLLHTSVTYSFSTFEDFSVSEDPVTPRPVLTLVIAIGGGLLLGVLVAVALGRPVQSGD